MPAPRTGATQSTAIRDHCSSSFFLDTLKRRTELLGEDGHSILLQQPPVARKLGIAPASGSNVAELRFEALLQGQYVGESARIVRSATTKFLEPHPQRLEIPRERFERSLRCRRQETMMHESIQLALRIGQRLGRRVHVRGVDELAYRAGRPQDREPGIDRRRESAGELAPTRGQRRLESASLADRTGGCDEDTGHGAVDEVTPRLRECAVPGTSRMFPRRVHPIGGRRDHRVVQAQLVDAGKCAQTLPGFAPHGEREQPHESAAVAALGGGARLKVLDNHPRPDVVQRRKNDAGPVADPVLGFKDHAGPAAGSLLISEDHAGPAAGSLLISEDRAGPAAGSLLIPEDRAGRAAGSLLVPEDRAGPAAGSLLVPDDDTGRAAGSILGFHGYGAECPRGVPVLAAAGDDDALPPGTSDQPPFDLVEPAAPAQHRAVPIRDLEAHEQMSRQHASQPRRRPGIARNAYAAGPVEEPASASHNEPSLARVPAMNSRATPASGITVRRRLFGRARSSASTLASSIPGTSHSNRPGSRSISTSIGIVNVSPSSSSPGANR